MWAGGGRAVDDADVDVDDAIRRLDYLDAASPLKNSWESPEDDEAQTHAAIMIQKVGIL